MPHGQRTNGKADVTPNRVGNLTNATIRQGSAQTRIRIGIGMNINCLEVINQLSAYMDHDVPSELRHRIREHLADCKHCTAVLMVCAMLFATRTLGSCGRESWWNGTACAARLALSTSSAS